LQAAGVLRRLHRVLLERLHEGGEGDWSRVSLEGAPVPAQKGPATGLNPTGRGKPGTERHLVTDGRGTSLGFCLSGANRQDGVMMAEALDAIPSRHNGQRRRRRTDRVPTYNADDARHRRQE
jgi:hypothetical protein